MRLFLFERRKSTTLRSTRVYCLYTRACTMHASAPSQSPFFIDSSAFQKQQPSCVQLRIHFFLFEFSFWMASDGVFAGLKYERVALLTYLKLMILGIKWKFLGVINFFWLFISFHYSFHFIVHYSLFISKYFQGVIHFFLHSEMHQPPHVNFT